MRKPCRYLFLVLSLLMVLAALFGCASAQSEVNPDLVWTVDVVKTEVKEKLEGVITVTQYNGTKYDEFHQQLPEEGNVFVILRLNVNKQLTDPTPFVWSELKLRDSAGAMYPRSEDDSFLEMYKYAPRMTGLEMKLSGNEGWICFEIPQQATEGPLTLIYNGEGSQQAIELRK